MTGGRAWWPLAGFVGVVAGVACGGGFACKGDDDCRSAQGRGTCEATGWCSFPDPSCASGQRYGEHAGGGLARACVASDGQADSGSEGVTTTTSSTGTGNSSSGGGVEASTQAGSSGSGASEGTPASCGDGVLDEAELCDDGNQVDGDGCSSSCVTAGTVQWSITLAGDAYGTGQSIERLPGGDLVVGVALSDGPTSRSTVRRIDPEAATSWSWEYEFAGDAVFTWGLAVTDVSSESAIAVAAYGYDDGAGVIARLGGDGQAFWQVETASTSWFGAALPQNGQLWAAGSAAGEAVLHAYDDQGVLLEELTGPPYAPVGATFFDLIAVPGGLAGAGDYATMRGREGFVRESNAGGSVTTSLTFAPSTDTEVLALALDPALPERRWVVGYAGAQGGWVGRVDDGIQTVAPTIVTQTFSANLHGVAVDAMGNAIAVGWDSTHGTRDPYVVKVAPGGEVVWSATEITDDGDDDLRDVTVGEDGAIYVVGTRIDVGGTAQAWIARLTP